MEAAYGLGTRLTFLSDAAPDRLMAALQVNPSLQTSVESIIKEEFDRAKAIVAENCEAVLAVQRALFSFGELDGEEVSALFPGKQVAAGAV